MEQKVRREVQEVRWVRSGSDVGVRSRDRARDVTDTAHGHGRHGKVSQALCGVAHRRTSLGLSVVWLSRCSVIPCTVIDCNCLEFALAIYTWLFRRNNDSGERWLCHIPCPTRDQLPPPDPAGPRPGPPDPSPSIRTFCSTYFLLTHFLHVILGPHSGLRLPPDTRPTPLHHSVYPSALLTLFVFTRLHPFPCTGLRLLSLLTGLRPDLLYRPAPLVYKSALLYTRSSVRISC